MQLLAPVDEKREGKVYRLFVTNCCSICYVTLHLPVSGAQEVETSGGANGHVCEVPAMYHD